MAGRPKTMVKRVERLGHQVVRLRCDLEEQMPEQYMYHPDDRDPINKAWNRARDAASLATAHLGSLSGLLREKAKSTRSSPTAVVFDEAEQPEPDTVDAEKLAESIPGESDGD